MSTYTHPAARPTSADITRVSDVGTIVFVVVALAAAVDRRQLHLGAVVVSLVLFAAGCALFLWAFFTAVARSRTDEIGMGGLYFLQGSAPRDIQRRLLGALAVQVVAALATAAARPFTDQAFVILAPMFGMGLAGLWGARYGQFPRRVADADDERGPGRG